MNKDKTFDFFSVVIAVALACAIPALLAVFVAFTLMATTGLSLWLGEITRMIGGAALLVAVFSGTIAVVARLARYLVGRIGFRSNQNHGATV